MRRPIGAARVRAEIARRLQFDAEIMICQGREIVRLLSLDVFANAPPRPGVVRFVSILARIPRSAPKLPLILPPNGPWLVKVLARDGRFVLGMYRPHMKVIGYLGALDRIFGVMATTRSWKTITAIAQVLEGGGERGRRRR